MVESISSPSPPRDLDAALAYCADQVKQFDRDRYTICAATPPPARRALYALFAFNLEVAKIREIVSEPMLGQIRLQWWREAIDGIYAGTPRDHAVVTALADAVERRKPARERFDRLIDAREFDMEDRQPDTLDDLIGYTAATSGGLSCLILEVLGGDDPSILEKGNHAGIAWALNGLIRAIPFQAAQGRCYLPKEITDAHGLSLKRLFAGLSDEKLSEAVAVLADTTRRHLEMALEDRYDKISSWRPAFAGLAVVAAELRHLKEAAYDVFAVRPLGPFRRRWLLTTRTLR